MGLFSWFKGKSVATTSPPPFNYYDYFILNKPPEWDNVALQDAMKTIGIVYRCVKMISDDVSQAKWNLYIKNNEGKSEKFDKRVANDIVLKVLAKPNKFMTWQQLVWNIVANMNLTGDGLWLKYKSAKYGKTVGLTPLNPVEWAIKLNSNGEPQYWEHLLSDLKYDYDDVIHFKFNNPADILRGLSPMRAAKLAAENVTYAGLFNRNFYHNSANPSGAFILPQGVTYTDQEFNRLKRQLDTIYTGVKNTGKPMLLEKGMTFQKLQMSHQDLQYAENRVKDNKEVALVFGIPEAILYGTSATYAASIQAEKDYAKRTLTPILNLIKETLNRFFVSEFHDETYYLDYESVIPEDIQFQVSKLGRYVDVGIMTRNEARAEIDLEPIDNEFANTLNGAVTIDTAFDNKWEVNDNTTATDGNNQVNPTEVQDE